MLSQTLFVVAFVLLPFIACVDLYDTNEASCANDLENICGVSAFPDSIQALYDSRKCLKKNVDFISKECLDYLELDKPSIVDSCFTEVKTYCFNVAPGSYRIHNCLSAVQEEDLSANCKAALDYDTQLIEEKSALLSAADAEVGASFWKGFTEYLSVVKDLVVEKVDQVENSFSVADATNYLRGITFLHEATPAEGKEVGDDYYTTEGEGK